MNIKLEKLKLINFKGIKSLEVDFSAKTDILGANATGKSTLFDAFTWLLFGKNSADLKDFNIKTIASNGSPKNKLEHEVTGQLLVEGVLIELRRTYKEKWTTKRGSEDAEFSGHETTYFWNDVPLQQGEYQAKIAEIIPEHTFKLLTNPYYFNNVMKWQDRRDLLFNMGGNVKDQEVVGKDKDMAALLELMQLQSKSVEDLKKEYASKKKLLKDSIKMIPSRIDEVDRSLPAEVDAKAIEKEITSLEEQIEEIQEKIMDASKAIADHNHAYHQMISEIQESKHAISSFEARVNNQYEEKDAHRQSQLRFKRQQLSGLLESIGHVQKEIESFKAGITSRDTNIANYRQQWVDINESTLDITPDQLTCPTCKREYDDIHDRKDQMIENFNTDKVKKLAAISQMAKELKGLNEQQQLLITEKNKVIDDLKKETMQLNAAVSVLMEGEPRITDLTTMPEYMSLILKRDELEQKFSNTPKLQDDNNGILNEQRKELVVVMEGKKALLGSADVIARGKARIKELEDEEKSLAQQIADLEKVEYAIEKYTKIKVGLIENKINTMFDGVKFKMFNNLINGGEEPVCETLIDNVPWPDVNHAAQINAGISIINTFSRHYNITAPIWVDNAEAVCKLADTPSQMIRLIVSAEHPELTIHQ